MSFDHLASIIFQKNQRVWSVNYMSLKPYFYIAIECYCFQTFKDLSALSATQFFDWGAKVSAICIQTKSFFTFQQLSTDFFKYSCWRTVVFFKRIANIGSDTITTNFFFKKFITFFTITASLLRTYFQFFKMDCKDKGWCFSCKFFILFSNNPFAPAACI